MTTQGGENKVRRPSVTRLGQAMIRVQEHDFEPAKELDALLEGRTDVGAVVTFMGLVRDMAGEDAIEAMTLEHYAGMTEKMLAEIEQEACRRWPLQASLIIHRHGRLEPGERIVYVATVSAHRRAAFEANMFLIDWLKTKAPFWKQEDRVSGTKWVESRESDDAAAARWEPPASDEAAE